MRPFDRNLFLNGEDVVYGASATPTTVLTVDRRTPLDDDMTIVAMVKFPTFDMIVTVTSDGKDAQGEQVLFMKPIRWELKTLLSISVLSMLKNGGEVYIRVRDYDHEEIPASHVPITISWEE